MESCNKTFWMCVARVGKAPCTQSSASFATHLQADSSNNSIQTPTDNGTKLELSRNKTSSLGRVLLWCFYLGVRRRRSAWPRRPRLQITFILFAPLLFFPFCLFASWIRQEWEVLGTASEPKTPLLLFFCVERQKSVWGCKLIKFLGW